MHTNHVPPGSDAQGRGPFEVDLGDEPQSPEIYVSPAFREMHERAQRLGPSPAFREMHERAQRLGPSPAFREMHERAQRLGPSPAFREMMARARHFAEARAKRVERDSVCPRWFRRACAYGPRGVQRGNQGRSPRRVGRHVPRRVTTSSSGDDPAGASSDSDGPHIVSARCASDWRLANAA